MMATATEGHDAEQMLAVSSADTAATDTAAGQPVDSGMAGCVLRLRAGGLYAGSPGFSAAQAEWKLRGS